VLLGVPRSSETSFYF